jgi:hypothetical protein
MGSYRKNTKRPLWTHIWSCYPHLTALACTVELYIWGTNPSLYICLHSRICNRWNMHEFFEPRGRLVDHFGSYVFSCNSLGSRRSFLDTHNKSSKPLSLSPCVDLNSNSIISACNLLTRQPWYNGVFNPFSISNFFNCLALHHVAPEKCHRHAWCHQLLYS